MSENKPERNTRDHPSKGRSIAVKTYKKRNPDATLKEIGKEFNMPYWTVWRILNKKIKMEQLGRNASLKKNNVKQRQKEDSFDDKFQDQLHYAMTQLVIDDKIEATDRASTLERIMKTMKLQQAMNLQAHLKKTDAEVIAAMIRFLKPDATQDDIIKLYKQAEEFCRQDLS